MKKILVLFATVVVMMMVTGCENPASIPADVHIPTQEEEWMNHGYRYCGDVDERDKDAVGQFFDDSKCEYEFTENGKYYVKFPLSDESVVKIVDKIGDNGWDGNIGYYTPPASHYIIVKVHKNGNKLDTLVIEPCSQW